MSGSLDYRRSRREKEQKEPLLYSFVFDHHFKGFVFEGSDEKWITMDHIGHDKRPIQWEQYRRSWNTHESDCHLELNHTISWLRGDISGLDSKLYPQIVVGENPSNG